MMTRVRSTAATEAAQGVDGAQMTVHERDEAQVRAACAGDSHAFQHLYSRYRGAVRAVVLSQVGWQDADDLTQDVFLVAWQRLDQLREASRFGPWLLQCARNRCHDQHRRKRPVIIAAAPDTAHASMPPRAEALEVLAAIQELSPSYRETLLMRLVEGMSGPEIAAQTGLTPRSVRVNLHRGLKKLREALGEDPKGGAR
jgi:RNA polymerase sigma-70 factor (ECF subfamily)